MVSFVQLVQLFVHLNKTFLADSIEYRKLTFRVPADSNMECVNIEIAPYPMFEKGKYSPAPPPFARSGCPPPGF